MIALELTPRRRRLARAAARGALGLVVTAAGLLAAGSAGLWVTHHPEQLDASGDELTVLAVLIGALALAATETVMSTLVTPLWNRLDDAEAEAEVLGFLTDALAADLVSMSDYLSMTPSDLLAVLTDLEKSGRVTSHLESWTSPHPYRLYAVAPQA